jgi:hypothetical protein
MVTGRSEEPENLKIHDGNIHASTTSEHGPVPSKFAASHTTSSSVPIPDKTTSGQQIGIDSVVCICLLPKVDESKMKQQENQKYYQVQLPRMCWRERKKR